MPHRHTTQETPTAGTRYTRTYATETRGAVAMRATDGEFYWLTTMTGRRISPFYRQRAYTTIEARRQFGRLAHR